MSETPEFIETRIEGDDGWGPALPAISPTVEPETPVILGTDTDGKAECPGCGGRFKVTAEGKITGQHKCPGVRQIDPAKRGKAPSRKSKGRMPKELRDLASSIIGEGIEQGAKLSISRSVPMDINRVPPVVVGVDEDAMIAPLLDALWPQIPAGAQRALTSIADRAELIACLMAWWQYQSGIRRFIEASRETPQSSGPNLSAVPPFRVAEGNGNGTSGADGASQAGANGSGQFTGADEFRPA